MTASITKKHEVLKIEINNKAGIDDITVYIDKEKIIIEFFLYVYAAAFKVDDIIKFFSESDAEYLAEKFFKYDVCRKSEEKKHFSRLMKSIDAIKSEIDILELRTKP